MTTKTTDTTYDAGPSPAPREAHQRANGNRNLVEVANSGTLPYLPWTVEQRATIEVIARRLEELGVAHLYSEPICADHMDRLRAVLGYWEGMRRKREWADVMALRKALGIPVEKFDVKEAARTLRAYLLEQAAPMQ